MASVDNTSDILTKYLQPPLHEKHAHLLHITQEKWPPRPVLTNCALTCRIAPSPTTRHRQQAPDINQQMKTRRNFPPSFKDHQPHPLHSQKDNVNNTGTGTTFTHSDDNIHTSPLLSAKTNCKHLITLSTHRVPRTNRVITAINLPPSSSRGTPPSFHIQTQASQRNVSEKHFRKQKRFYTNSKCPRKYKTQSMQTHSRQRRINSRIQARVHQHTPQSALITGPKIKCVISTGEKNKLAFRRPRGACGGLGRACGRLFSFSFNHN